MSPKSGEPPTEVKKYSVVRDLITPLMRRYRPSGAPKFQPGLVPTDVKESIRKNGVLQPITLAIYDPPNLIVADGNTRVLACRELVAEGHPEFEMIPGIIDPTLDRAGVLRLMIETEKRSARDPLDIGRHVKEFMETLDPPSQKVTAVAMKTSESTISRLLLPWQYDDSIIALIAAGKLSLSHLAVVNQLKDLPRQTALLKESAEKELTAAGLKALAFKPARKPVVSKFHTIEESEVKVTMPKSLSVAEFLAATARIAERMKENLKTYDKGAIRVIDLEPPK